MIDPKMIKALFYETHKAIKESSADVVNNLAEVEVAYPPGSELTVSEIAALKTLELSPDAKSGLQKLISDACSYPSFHLFSLMDGVADPESDDLGDWY